MKSESASFLPHVTWVSHPTFWLARFTFSVAFKAHSPLSQEILNEAFNYHWNCSVRLTIRAKQSCMRRLCSLGCKLFLYICLERNKSTKKLRLMPKRLCKFLSSASINLFLVNTIHIRFTSIVIKYIFTNTCTSNTVGSELHLQVQNRKLGLAIFW